MGLDVLSQPLAAFDPEIAAAGGAELGRRQSTLEMIASENFAPRAVLQAQGSVLTGGTDVHVVLVDLRRGALDGRQAEDRLHGVGIANRNAVPFDPRPPMVSSGLRVGTPALATRGFGDAEFREVADVIARTLMPERLGHAQAEELRARVAKLAAAFPLYPGLTGAAA